MGKWHIVSLLASFYSTCKYIHTNSRQNRRSACFSRQCTCALLGGPFLLKRMYDPDPSPTKRDPTQPNPNRTNNQMTGEVGSYRYMAPELVRHEPYNSKVDIYSWAILSWEMLAVDKPYAGIGESTFIKVHAAALVKTFVCLGRLAGDPLLQPPCGSEAPNAGARRLGIRLIWNLTKRVVPDPTRPLLICVRAGNCLQLHNNNEF